MIDEHVGLGGWGVGGAGVCCQVAGGNAGLQQMKERLEKELTEVCLLFALLFFSCFHGGT